MARIDPLPPRDWPAGMRDALAAMTPPEPRHPPLPTEGRPKGLNVLGTFAHHPALAKAFFAFNGHVIRGTTLTARQREMLVLRVAAVRGCDYEWAQHVVIAGDVGLTDDEVDRIATDPASSAWTDLELALLRSVDELVADGAIAEPTWAALSDELDHQQLLDLVFTVGAYETLAWVMRSVDLRLDDDLDGRLPRAADG